ncbi:hypothetical protein [Paenibacillus sp. An7]|uniref:hypothetical protein n=1 Tax=Paenibacillus sp. An7 TaxID=2689577 RepID=UPI001356E372|nr:hypothetical protein [Paenibacillus sp. An7]
MDIYEKFNQLVNANDSIEIIDLLHDFKKSKKLSLDEEGWVYWNLSDNYALLRNTNDLYQNHLKFVNWGKTALYPEKLHWLVSDATQALTLSLTDHFKDWTEWYLYACTHSNRSRENRAVRFESHRTAAASSVTLKNIQVLDIALENMLRLIHEDDTWQNLLFSKIAYFSLLLERNYLHKDEEGINSIISCIYQLLPTHLDEICSIENVESAPPLLGSWSQLNYPRTSKRSLLIALNNLGCSFNRIEKHEDSLRMFGLVLDNGHKLNSYGLAKYLSSLWITEGDKDTVMNRFLEINETGQSFSDLTNFEPGLKELVV